VIHRLLPTTALALAVCLAPLPAEAQSGTRLTTHASPSTPSTAGDLLAPSTDIPLDSGGARLWAETQRCLAKQWSLDQDSNLVLDPPELDRIEPVVRDVDRDNDGKVSSRELQSACVVGILTDRDLRYKRRETTSKEEAPSTGGSNARRGTASRSDQ
jgi:hypothetical protein